MRSNVGTGVTNVIFEGRHFHQSYVTRDLDAAVEQFLASAAVRHERIFEPQAPPGGLSEGSSVLKQSPQNRMALLWVDNIQYEFIQPLVYSEVFSPAMPVDRLSQLHHTGIRIDHWDRFREGVSRHPFPVVMEGTFGEGRYVYLDTRALLGHMLECTYMTDAMWADIGWPS